MSMPIVNNCPGTLAEGHQTYSATCLRRMFDRKLVSHILPYNPAESDEDDAKKFRDNRKRISISGVQEKVSIIMDKNKLRLTEEGEQGGYILKPIPRDLEKVGQVPANEHLTMQLARQLFGINTAENALIFFKDGSPAYITRRFDVKADGTKSGTEDFASLAGKTSINGGPNFKYEYSYEGIANLISRYVAASAVEMEKFYSLVVFNYLFSNGDAHLKNFSLIQTANDDYILSPAYDLVNTRIHVEDQDFALSDGLFADDFESQCMRNNGWVGLEDFEEFARRIGISDQRREALLTPYRESIGVDDLIGRSFLDEATKQTYYDGFLSRHRKIWAE